MATFSPSQYQATLDSISTGLSKAQGNMGIVARNGAATATRIDEFLPGCGASVVNLLNEALKVLDRLLQDFIKLLEGAEAPLVFWNCQGIWESINRSAMGVAGEITPQVLGSTGDWSGPAATAYTAAIGPQSTAASSLATVANGTAQVLENCAIAGLVFYAALALALLEFLGIQVAAAVADATVEGIIAGLLVAIADGISTGAVIATLVASTGYLIEAQAAGLATLQGMGLDGAAFPGGHWPVATGV